MVPDLMFGSKISGAATSLGLASTGFRSVDRLKALIAEHGDAIEVIVVDLDCGDSAVAAIREARASSPDARCVAYGPHVDTERLDAARDAGATDVMTRGAFASGIMDVLRRRA